MFANKVLISVCLVAVIPVTFTRHVSQWGARIFPDDIVQNGPANNIEDLQIPGNDGIPDFENRHNFDEQQEGTRNDDDADARDLDIFGGNRQDNGNAQQDFRDSAVKVNAASDYSPVESVDVYNIPVFEGNDRQGEEQTAPEVEFVPIDARMQRMKARMQSPRIIVVERPGDEQFPDMNDNIDITEMPQGQDNNVNNGYRDWDNDVMTNEIPDTAANNLKWM